MARRPSSAIHSSSSSQLGRDLPALGELLLREQAGLDPLGELDLHLGVEERHLADLLEVVLHGVGGGAGHHHLLLGLVGVVGLGDHETGRRLLLVLDDRGVGGDGLLELLVRQVGEHLLAVGAHDDLRGGVSRRGRRRCHGRLVGRLGRGLLRRLGLRGRLGRGLLRRGLRRLGRRRLLRGRGRDRAHAHRHGDGDAEAGQVRHQRLEVTRLDASLLGRPTYVVGGHAAGGLRLRDEGLDGGVREHARWRSLARVRGHEHLSSKGFGARQGPLSSRAALRILPRTWWQPRTAGPSHVTTSIASWRT